MLPSSALLFLLYSPPFSFLLLELCCLSGCNKCVLFNLRVSSLTESGLHKDSSTWHGFGRGELHSDVRHISNQSLRSHKRAVLIQRHFYHGWDDLF